MKEYLPKFHAYLRKKAELLGYENGLPWYELFAPMGDLGRKFTAKEAREYLISHFAPFSQELSDMINQAFEEKWIDFYPSVSQLLLPDFHTFGIRKLRMVNAETMAE